MNRKLLLILAALITTPLLLIAATGGFLLFTQSGAQWLFSRLQERELLSYQNIRGSIGQGLQIESLVIETTSNRISIRNIDADIALSHLLKAELHIDRLASSELSVLLKPQPEDSPPNVFDIKKLLLSEQPLIPVRLSLGQLTINQLLVKTQSEEYPLQNLNLTGQFDQHGIQHLALQLNHPWGHLKADGFAHLGPALRTNLNVDWSVRLPNEEIISGNTQLQGNKNQLLVSQQTSEDVASTIQLKVVDLFTQPKLDVKGQLDSLYLPSVSSTQLSHVQFKFKGTTEKLETSMKGNIRFQNLSDIGFDLLGTIDRQKIKVSQLALNTDAGVASFNGIMSWDEGKTSWRGTATSEAFAANQIHPLLPEKVNGALQITGSQSDQLQLEFSSQGLSGQFREFSFNSALSGHWQDNTLYLEQLNATVGESQLSLSGSAGADKLDAIISLDAPNIGFLSPGATGSLRLNGTLSGTPTLPNLQAQGEGVDLSFSGLSVAGFSFMLNLNQGLFKADGNHIDFNDLKYQSIQLDSASLMAEGNWKQPQLSVNAQNSKAALVMVSDTQFSPNQVSGAIKDLQLIIDNYGRWQLDNPATFQYHQTRGWSLTDLCLTEQASHLCTQAAANTNHLGFTLKGTQLPLSLLNMVAPLPVVLEGRLDIDALIEKTDGHLTGYSKLSQGSFKEPLLLFIDPSSKTPLSLNAVAAEVAIDGQRLTGQLSATINTSGSLNGQLNIDNLLAPDGPLNAEFNYDIPDLTPYTDISPTLGFTSGKLSGSLTVSGTRKNPVISTDTELNIPGLLIHPLAIEWHDVVVKIKTNPHRSTEIAASLRAGEGILQMNGQLTGRSSRDWAAKLNLSGDNILLIDQPDRRLIANPDLQVVATQDGIQVDGKMVIPEARLIIKPTSGKLAITEDARIHDENATAQQPALSVSASAEVIFGDRVHIEAYGLKTNLTGKMLLFRKARSALLGEGELDLVNGYYKAYGQDLKIDKGKLQFSGSIVRPTLDIKAQRVAGDVTAGLHVTGSIDNLQSRLFSSPALTDSEALSYIIRGKPLSESSSADKSLFSNAALSYAIGQSTSISTKIAQLAGLDELGIEAEQGIETLGFSLGKHLTPNLYVRYGIGVVDKVNKLFTQYQISEKLFLQSEIGEGQSIDLIYRVK